VSVTTITMDFIAFYLFYIWFYYYCNNFN